MKWLIAYDVAHPRRLRRCHRVLCAHAIPLQESVFLFDGSKVGFHACMRRVCALLHARDDDLRAYPLPHGGLCRALGNGALPEGIYLNPLGNMM